ncbi:hypothetical protein QUB68_06010 [Microcoleus sp. A006_D1]|uniref:hypothetical protein n=1 Tax=Microcoleus sp. A006_D1 TaxID=3055267 RepID=UPI002FD367C1
MVASIQSDRLKIDSWWCTGSSIVLEVTAETAKTSLQLTNFRVCNFSYIQGAFNRRVFLKRL